jgi:hypothetical protein
MRTSRSSLGLAALLLIGIAALVAITQKQAIADWWELRGYTPPAPIVNLASQDTMTDQGRHIFYVNHPQVISNIAAFRSQCNFEEQTIVLGCYHPKQQGIDVFEVNDARLNGVEEVTAAHEMLHAAYDRLGTKEKATINAELIDFYEHKLDDPRVHQTIDLYKQTEPNDVINEMHSVFGTEVGTLPQTLENYYQRYFADRSTVAQLAASYQAEFTSRLNQITTYDKQLATMKAQIDTDEQSLSIQLQGLDADRDSVERSRSSSVVARYNSRVNAYNAGIRRLQAEITEYNDLVDRRNTLATELKGLQSSIDTRLTTQPSQ